MSTVDTSGWSPDTEQNVSIEGIPLNSDAGIAQTWQALRVLMAAVKGDGDAIKAMIDVMQGATAYADGASGLVPKPEAGDQDKVLKGDGTWGSAADSNAVHKTGDEIVSGVKTFSNAVVVPNDTSPSIKTVDNDGRIVVVAGSNAQAASGAKLYLNGAGYADAGSAGPGGFALQAGTSAGNVQLAGTAAGALTWDGADITGDVHIAGSETITGAKTFSSNVTIETSAGARILCAVSGNSTEAKNWRLWFGCGTSGNGGIYDDTRSKYIFERTITTGVLTLQAYPDSGGSAKSLVLKPDGTALWDGQQIQTASDERLKTPLSSVPDVVLDAWGDVNWGQFQFLESVQEKGESARLHLGLIAQRVKAAFEARGLDACAYGILCHEVRSATEEEEVVDLWTVRYGEALAMEAAYQRRRADRLEARIVALEEAMHG